VQYVIRPNLNFRGFAGQIASGVVRPGDAVTVLPSGHTSRVKSIVTRDGDLEEAFAPMSVTICLEDEIDVSRGDMLVGKPGTDGTFPYGKHDPVSDCSRGNVPSVPGFPAHPHAGRRFEAAVVWMGAKPLEPHRPYFLKHTTQTVQARVRGILHRVDINTLDDRPAAQLQLNEIGVVSLEAQRPLFFDAYQRNRATGSFILIDPIGNETLGAGMITRPWSDSHSGPVTAVERTMRIGHRPFVVRLPGGDLAMAQSLERHLFDLGFLAHTVQAPMHLAQAVLTGVEAGIVSILFGAMADDPSAIPAGLPPLQVVTVEASAFAGSQELLHGAAAMIESRDAERDGLIEGAGI